MQSPHLSVFLLLITQTFTFPNPHLSVLQSITQMIVFGIHFCLLFSCLTNKVAQKDSKNTHYHVTVLHLCQFSVIQTISLLGLNSNINHNNISHYKKNHKHNYYDMTHITTCQFSCPFADKVATFKNCLFYSFFLTTKALLHQHSLGFQLTAFREETCYNQQAKSFAFTENQRKIRVTKHAALSKTKCGF